MKDTVKKKQINVDIGSRIKQARNQKRITQEQLADMVDVSVQYVSDLERGVTGSSVSTIIRICQVLDVSSDYLLLGKTSNPDPVLEQKLQNVTPRQKAAILEILDKVLNFSEEKE